MPANMTPSAIENFRSIPMCRNLFEPEPGVNKLMINCEK